MKDDEADRVLNYLVGVVIIAGGACLVWAGVNLTAPASILYPVIAGGLVVVASSYQVRLSVRGQYLVTAAGAAQLVAIAMLPSSWAIVCVAGGTVLAKTLRWLPLRKMALNVAKDTLGAALGAASFAFAGVAPLTQPSATPTPWWQYLGMLAVALLALVTVDHLTVIPVIALASRTPWRQVAVRDVGAGVVVWPGDWAIAAATVALFAIDPLLVVATPVAVVLTFHAHQHRWYLRDERRAWQRLAASTDALSSVSVDEVLHTAIRGAADLFPDLEIEVELRLSEKLHVVRGDQTGILYDGDPAPVPARPGPVCEVPLDGEVDSGAPLGWLRLRFPVEVRLSDREQHMLTTFAAGLSTAIRNVYAYAEVSRLADKNAYDATHDALTDLPNRRWLNERATQLLSQPGRGQVALMLLDLDYFKEVNDTLGHDAGDRVLAEIADRLSEAAGDALVARLGGDEFAILFSDLRSSTAAARRARQVLESLRQPMDLDGVLISLHTSAGLAIAGGDSTDPVEMLRRADVAMYQAKESGRQVAIYARARDSADLTRLALAGALPRAVEDGEFTVFFQPIVDLASGQAIGAEALTRWAHPDLGNLPPSTFLGLIERSGLLAPFTEAVLDRALAAAASWRAEGFDLEIAVNVSPRSLADPRLPKTVLHALDSHGVEPGRLTLELTETSAIGHLDVVTRGAAALRDAGVKIALDDFGTRHSSLSAVFQVPVNELKIDRTFVAQLDSSPEAMAVVRAIIELGRSLDLAVVAEGIEEPVQRHALWELGCTSGQGSLFGWPPHSSEDLLISLRCGFHGVPGALAPQLHPEATVVRLPRQASRTESEPHVGRQVEHS